MNAIKRNTLILLTLIVLDQLLKCLVVYYKPTLDLVIFSIQEVHNTGASFGMLQGQNEALIYVSLLALGVIMMNLKNIKDNYELPLTLITAGIIGNLIDRVFRGFVVDFFDLGWWPIFNLADSCIFIGVAWIIILLLIEKEEAPKKKKVQRKKKPRKL